MEQLWQQVFQIYLSSLEVKESSGKETSGVGPTQSCSELTRLRRNANKSGPVLALRHTRVCWDGAPDQMKYHHN